MRTLEDPPRALAARTASSDNYYELVDAARGALVSMEGRRREITRLKDAEGLVPPCAAETRLAAAVRGASK